MQFCWGQEYSLQSVPRLQHQQHFQKRRPLHITSVAILEMSVTAECAPRQALALGHEARKMTLALQAPCISMHALSAIMSVSLRNI